MSAAVGWSLAVLALAAGFVGYGWPGVVLALSVVVFWLLLQFSRSLRAMKAAATNPVGHVDNAVMLHARLRAGMRLPDLLTFTRSLGLKLEEDTAAANATERYAWTDAAGDAVHATLQGGRLTQWQLVRALNSEASTA